MKGGLLAVAGGAMLLLQGHRDAAPRLVGRYSIKTWNVQLNLENAPLTQRAATLPMIIEISRAIYRDLDSHREHFVVLFLDTKRKVFGYKVLFSGNPIGCTVSTGEVFRQALLMGAHSIVVVHNHPSGDPLPSREDREITEDLAKAAELVEVQIVDHLVLSVDGYFSILKPRMWFASSSQ